MTEPNMNKAVASLHSELAIEDMAAIRQTNAYSRFKDIENNVSVRDEFTREDYEYFRSSERIPSRKKAIIKAARKAYEKIGVVRNIIDLMGDFTCQGIEVKHESPQIEDFYQAWFKRVSGKERSERFANLLYREANVIVKRDTARLNQKNIDNLRRSWAADITVDQLIKVQSREIPFKYTFLSPTQVDVMGDDLAQFVGEFKLGIKLNDRLINIIKNPKETEKELVSKLPTYIIEAASNKGYINLDSDKTKVYFYKKDDWDVWATPMIYPIMDDLVMLEKLKLADLTSLDGAISHIRLWRFGSFEHKIIPDAKKIKQLRNILLNAGTGSMDLVWTPELDFKETSSDLSKYLGIEKYKPTMMNIFQGLGIPPTLTGGAAESGYTNNFLSLKTLVERLNYGRSVLTRFWEEEIRIVQKAMGFRKPARIAYDHMSLSDESSFLALLVQLVDRNIVSEDAVRERFGEISDIEISRIKKQESMRNKGTLPPKTSPFHSPNLENDLKKIALQKGYAPKQVGLELQEASPDEIQQSVNLTKPKGQPGQGRPKNSKDTSIRKPRTVKPRSGEAVLKDIVWAEKAYADMAEFLLPGVLSAYGCKNVRSMTDKQTEDFERLKFGTFCQIKPQSNLTEAVILEALKNSKVPDYVQIVYNQLVDGIKDANVNVLRRAQVIAHVSTYADIS